MASQIKLSTNQKLGLIGNLSTLLIAGIPIHEAVSSLLEDTKGDERKVLLTLQEGLMQGKRICTSFALFPRVFDKITVNLIKAAEEAGTLETTLEDLRIHMEKDREFVDRVRFAMIYPLLITGVFFIVLLVILVFVIPKFAAVFIGLNIKLPLATRALIFLSDVLLHQTLYVFGVVLIFITALAFLFKYARNFLLEMFYSLPLVNRLIKEIDFTRFSRSLSLLLNSGIPITTALELTQDVVIRRQTSNLIVRCREMIASGKRLSDGLRTGKKLIPAMMIKLIEAGEKSGTLDKSMQNISVYLDYQVSNTLKTLTTVLEPIMLVVIGLCVGGMMVAIIGPIYSFMGAVGTQ